MRLRLFGALLLSGGIAMVVLAQQPRFGGGMGGGAFNAAPARMLGSKTVQEELKLSDDQIAQVKAVNEKTMEMFKDIPKDGTKEEKMEAFKKIGEKSAEEAEKLVKSLKPEQVTRLKELQLQVVGPALFTMDENAQKMLGLTEQAKKITLSDSQKEKFTETREAMGKEMQEFKGFDPDTKKKRDVIANEYKSKFVDILTPEQKKTWTEMIGKPVDIKFENPFGKRNK
ncbi:MAG TPA: hypothetical protein VKS79_26585 [Gemmataceae bacterium]|nr:hypothetical protein [Gemmataceae bacterium]